MPTKKPARTATITPGDRLHVRDEFARRHQLKKTDDPELVLDDILALAEAGEGPWDRQTFVGTRRLAEFLNMNKPAVQQWRARKDDPAYATGFPEAVMDTGSGSRGSADVYVLEWQIIPWLAARPGAKDWRKFLIGVLDEIIECWAVDLPDRLRGERARAVPVDDDDLGG